MESCTKTAMRDQEELPPLTDDEDNGDVNPYEGQRWGPLNYQIQALRDDIRAANWDTEQSGEYEPLPVPTVKRAGVATDWRSTPEWRRLQQVRKERRWAND